MKLKLREMEEILVGLDRVKFKMPTKTAYWLGIFNQKLKGHGEIFSERTRDLLEKYAEKGDDGKYIMVGESSVKLKDADNYNKELRELKNIEIDIPFKLMPIEAFCPNEKVKDGKEEKEVEPFNTLSDMEVLGRFIIPLEE